MEEAPTSTGPTCAHCHLAIPDDAPTFQGPTCPCKLHAACATSMLVQAGRMIYAQPTVACPSCSATWLIYENISIGWHPSGYETPPPEPEGDPLPALLQNATFKKDLKALRSRIAQWRKATAADKAFQVNALRTWRQQVAPYEATLKAMKKEALKNIATSAEHKEFRKTHATARGARERFRTKYGLKRTHLRKLLPKYFEVRSRRWHVSRLNRYKWRFRIRI